MARIRMSLREEGTSIGANIREAKYAHGKPDFIAKLQIALKECYETEYWLEIAQKTISFRKRQRDLFSMTAA